VTEDEEIEVFDDVFGPVTAGVIELKVKGQLRLIRLRRKDRYSWEFCAPKADEGKRKTEMPGWYPVHEVDLDFDVEEGRVLEVEQTQFYCLVWAREAYELDLMLLELVDELHSRFSRIGIATAFVNRLDLPAGVRECILPYGCYNRESDFHTIYIV
jgi:hypothetical protein